MGESTVPVLDTPIYVGASLEFGNVWQDTSQITLENTRAAGSIFVVMDTILGPLYLAFGLWMTAEAFGLTSLLGRSAP